MSKRPLLLPHLQLPHSHSLFHSSKKRISFAIWTPPFSRDRRTWKSISSSAMLPLRFLCMTGVESLASIRPSYFPLQVNCVRSSLIMGTTRSQRSGNLEDGRRRPTQRPAGSRRMRETRSRVCSLPSTTSPLSLQASPWSVLEYWMSFGNIIS